MAALRQMLLDLYTPLSFKAPMADPRRAGLAKTWMTEEHLRRITSYHVLDGYLENASREFLETTDQRDNRREYGEPQLLVERVVAAILGEDVTIAVDGADTEIPDAPDLPEPPEPPDVPDGDTPFRRIQTQLAANVYEFQVEMWQARSQQAIDEWERAWREQPGLVDIQSRLRDWADLEQFETKLRVGEGKAVGLGDAVFALGWDDEKQRPVMQTYDPRAYFPVLDDDAFRRGFPTKVHLAWEEERRNPNGDPQTWVRRITYELVPTAEPIRYPWAPDEDSWWRCTLTDAEWLLSDGEDWVVDAVDPARATYRRLPGGVDENGELVEGDEIRDLDLGIDFIPLLHVPGIPTDEHYGRSILARVLQLLDDLQASDSDLQAAAALAGTPIVALAGKNATGGEFVVEPGAVFSVGEGGRMDVVDLSASVEALRAVIADLLERLSVNISIPGEILGRVDETGAESGFARLLKLGPFSSLIGVLRLVRAAKYQLLLKMVQRLHQAGGAWEPGPSVDARLVFGSFLPADTERTITDVVALLQAKAITVETGLRILVQAGIEVSDIAEEAQRLRERDYEGAVALLDALGDEALVYEYLGFEPPAQSARPEPPPEIDLPQGGTLGEN